MTKGNRKNSRKNPKKVKEITVKFLQEIKKRHPGQRLLLIWDDASYHRGEEMKKLLAIENAEKIPQEWSITCQLFAP